MGKPVRTNYMPMSEFRRRAQVQARQGWRPILPKQVVVINPAYSKNFEIFAANVAHELRHYIVYRSDGGKFARGLVRATMDLQNMHQDMVGMDYVEGVKVRMGAALYRRQNDDPKKRYMMSVQFAHLIVTGEAEQLEARPEIVAKSDEALAERILDWMEDAGDEPKWKGERKQRIADWAKIARKLGYPKMMDLWHYNRGMVAKFVQVQFEHKRKQMTAGKPPPYDGYWGAEPWRVYPLKLIMAACKKVTNIDDCYPLVANQLELSERDILAMINDVWKAMQKYGSAHSQDFWPDAVTGSAEAKFRDLAPFLVDLRKQLNDVQSLMGPYTKYTQYDAGLFESY